MTTPNPPAGPPPGPLPPAPFRVGHGYDLHRLQPGGKGLRLGGVTVAQDVSPVAHSDGDMVIHAIVDALLGAMGWGDIGEHFPDTDARWKGAASRVFLETTYRRVVAAGYRAQNVDVTVLAERPKLKPFKAQIVQSLADLLRIPADRVNLKAGTNEGCDAVGRGEAIAAHAVVLLAADASAAAGAGGAGGVKGNA